MKWVNFFIVLLPVLSACVPTQQKSASCGQGQVFDTASRSCKIGANSNLNNQNPIFISLPAAVNHNEDNAYPITTTAFLVDEGAVTETSQNITWTFTSSNTALIPDSSIGINNWVELPGVAASTLAPRVAFSPVANTSGAATITVTMNDGYAGYASMSFSVTINALDDVPTFNAGSGIANTTSNEDATLTVTFAGDEGGAADENSQALTLTGISSTYPASLPVTSVGVTYGTTNVGPYVGGAIALGDSTASANAQNITLKFLPTAEQYGSFPLTVTLNDGVNSSTSTFTATIASVNDTPSYPSGGTLVSPATQVEDVALFSIAFALDEGGGTDENSQIVSVLGVTSSNTTLLPLTNIRFENLGEDGVGGVDLLATTSASTAPFSLLDNNGTTATSGDDALRLVLVPVANQNGLANITITFSDSAGSAATMSVISLSVTAVNDAPTVSSVSLPGTVLEGASPITVTFNVDEGGASDENTQSITFSATTGDATVIANSNISFSFVESGDASTNKATVVMSLNSTDVNTGISSFPVSITYSDGTNVASFPVYVDVDPLDDAEAFQTTASNITVNAGEINKMVTVTVTEGGNGAAGNFEIADIVTMSVASSNDALLPEANITISYGGVLKGNATLPRTLDSAVVAARDAATVLELNFVPGASGTSTISMIIDDNVASYPAVTQTFTVTSQDVVAVHNGWQNVKALGRTYQKDGSYTNPAVTINWREMSVWVNGIPKTANTGLWSWYIYRADATAAPNTVPTMDYNSPLNTVPAYTTTASYSYTDTTALPDKVYYYEVRPALVSGVPNSSPIPTNQFNYHKIRVVVPPDNMALVHRWPANQEACEAMGLTVDRNNNHRCPYTGPGRETTLDTYFDLSQDTMMDRYEAGCHYSDTSVCAGTGCISNLTTGDSPNTAYSAIAATAGRSFYDRTDQVCYVSNTSGLWVPVETASSAITYGDSVDASVPGLPPLTKLTQSDALDYCHRRVPTCAGVACTATISALFDNTGKKRLPTRKEFVTAAAWNLLHPLYNTDAKIEVVEDGLDLVDNGTPITAATGNCNTNRADGLQYFDLALPPASSFFDGLPNTEISNERKVRTGSAATQNCVSRWGIQDLVGNVREWNSDRCLHTGMDCTDVASASFPNTALTNYDYDYDGAASNGPGGAAIESATFQSESNAATYFYYPMGLPAVGAGSGALDIDAAAGVGKMLTTSMHSDIYDLNAASGATTRGFASGGHSDFSVDQADGAAAGRWTVELIPATEQSKHTGFRCAIGVQ